MVFGDVMQQFIQQAPFCVMARMTLEGVFAPSKLDQLFSDEAQRQYTRELLFSSVVDLMSLVVCRAEPSVHAAYRRKVEHIGVSAKALYDKLNGMEPRVSQALVRHTAGEAKALIHKLCGACRPLLPGYRVKHLDGNHLGSTEHRLDVLRHVSGGALPGFTLAVLDPETMTVEDVLPCEDGHTQECRLLPPLLEKVRPFELYVADRHFCTSEFLFGLSHREAFFAIRQHLGHLRWRTQGRCRRVGRTETGLVYEQAVVLTDPKTGEECTWRRITIKLDCPTRDGDHEIHILTNLPSADALAVARLYRERWTLETVFQQLTVHLKCELNTLGYPRAALFSFCVAVACYNVLAVMLAAMRAAHGEAVVEERLSHYYVAEELSGTYRGMMIALPPREWELFHTLTIAQLARALKQIAQRITWTRYQKYPRGPKKPKRARPKAPRKHFATARLLEAKSKEKTG